jgi:hypothetical protein
MLKQGIGIKEYKTYLEPRLLRTTNYKVAKKA